MIFASIHTARSAPGAPIEEFALDELSLSPRSRQRKH